MITQKEPECKTYKDGTKGWWLNGNRHHEDGPAIELANGHKEWWLNGKRHREDGPAVENANGDKIWHLNGILHREDGPAIENANGDKIWFLNNEPTDPETIVDLWLMRGEFCFYDKDNGCLSFG